MIWRGAVLALAMLAPAAQTQSTPDAAVSAIFAPYSRADMRAGAWERPIYTPALAALIARWRKATLQDEVDDLSDGDWLCQCQDWDERRFRAVVVARRLLSPRRAALDVRLTIAPGATRRVTLDLQRIGSRWLIEDLFDTEMPRGLRAALRETIAKDTHR